MAPFPTKTMPTRDAIFADNEAKQYSGFRGHLGGSLIGDECERSLFYTFRWATNTRHSGRLLRLFERGQLEEERFVKALRSIGATVLDIDPETGRQWQLSDPTGHAGGSMDGVALGLPEAPKTWAGLEMKTHSDKSFKSLLKDGVAKSKPLHWAQMHFYAELAGLDRFLYLAVNKNDDDIYTEWVHIDKALSMRLVAKAARVVHADTPAARISDNPAWFVCRFCNHNDVCHSGAMPERHCRSCIHSSPVDGGKWHCVKHDKPLDRDEQREGCPDQRYIPDFVRGKQVDIDGDSIVYEMPDKSIWKDDGIYS